MGDLAGANPNQGDGARKLSIAFVAAVALHAALLIPFYASHKLDITPASPLVVDLEASAIDTGTGTSAESSVVAVAPAAAPAAAAASGAAAQTASARDFVIPTPRTAVDPGAAPAVSPSFREEGGRTGAAAPLKAPDVQPKPPQTAASSGSSASAPPSKGQGVQVQGQTSSPGGSLDLGSLDKALAAKGSGAGVGPGTAAGAGTAAGTAGAAGSGATADAGAGIQWDKPAAAKNRKPLGPLSPEIPAWVGTQGLSLSVKVSFTVSSEGTVSSPKVEISSGYADVDAAVLKALRLWRFTEDASAPPLVGVLPYVIRVR